MNIIVHTTKNDVIRTLLIVHSFILLQNQNYKQNLQTNLTKIKNLPTNLYWKNRIS